MLGWLGSTFRTGNSAELRRAAIAAALLTSLNGVEGTLISPYLASLDYRLADIGLLVMVYAIASLASRVPAGRLADGRHIRRWYVLACVMCTVAMLLYGVVHEAWAVTLVRVLNGLGFGAATTLNFATFLTSTSPKDRARATSLYTAGISGGYSIGNFASGVLADNLGYQATYAIAGLFGFAAIFLAPRPLDRTGGRDTAAPTESIWRALKHAEVRAIPLFGLCITFMNQVIALLFPLYVLSVGESLTVSGISRSLHAISNTVARPFSSPLVAALGIVTLGCVGVGLNAFFMALIPFLSGAVPLILIAAFIGTGRAGAVVANACNTADVSARGTIRRGTASALMTGGQDIGSILAPLLGGIAGERLGVPLAMQVLPACAAVIAIGVMLAARDRLSAQGKVEAAALAG